MKEIVILSGKGGTGKSSVCSALAHIKKDNILVADCDVDAADLHLIMAPEKTLGVDFYSGVLAEIDAEKCTACGLCAEKCRFDAISPHEENIALSRLIAKAVHIVITSARRGDSDS